MFLLSHYYFVLGTNGRMQLVVMTPKNLNFYRVCSVVMILRYVWSTQVSMQLSLASCGLPRSVGEPSRVWTTANRSVKTAVGRKSGSSAAYREVETSPVPDEFRLREYSRDNFNRSIARKSHVDCNVNQNHKCKCKKTTAAIRDTCSRANR